jgi:copper chaperone
MTKTMLKIEGMSCNHCVVRVENALTGVEGVESAKVSLDEKMADVEYDESKADLEKFKKAVDEAGYKVVG